MDTHTHSFEAIGTHWYLEFAYDPLRIDAQRLVNDVLKRIEEFDKNYSRFRSDSLVTKIARASGTYRLPQDAHPMVALYKDLYALTDGAFTPLIGATISDAGYDAHYSLKTKEVHVPPSWLDSLTYEAPYLTVHQPVLLDFGAAGKGYLIDIVAHILKDRGVASYTIDAGGDIATYSKSGAVVRIGLEHPDDPSQALGVAAINNQSICGSAGNKRAWGNFHHIIDPRTLASPKNISATWVVAENTMLADALATCLYLVSPSVLASRYTFEYLILNADNSIDRSDSFPAEIFTSTHESHNEYHYNIS